MQGVTPLYEKYSIPINALKITKKLVFFSKEPIVMN